MSITWSDVAEADLDDLYDYIARDVPYYAEQFVDRLIDAARRKMELNAKKYPAHEVKGKADKR